MNAHHRKSLITFAAILLVSVGLGVFLAHADIDPSQVVLKQEYIGIGVLYSGVAPSPTGTMPSPLPSSSTGSVYYLFYRNRELARATVLPYEPRGNIVLSSQDAEYPYRTRVGIPYQMVCTISGMIPEGTTGATIGDTYMALAQEWNPSVSGTGSWIPSGIAQNRTNGTYTLSVVPTQAAGNYSERWHLDLLDDNGAVYQSHYAASPVMAIMPASSATFPLQERYTSSAQMGVVTLTATNLYPICRLVVTVQGPLDIRPQVIDTPPLLTSTTGSAPAFVTPRDYPVPVDLRSYLSISGQYTFEAWQKIPLGAPYTAATGPDIPNPELPLNSASAPFLVTQSVKWGWERIGQWTTTVAFDIQVNANITTK